MPHPTLPERGLTVPAPSSLALNARRFAMGLVALCALGSASAATYTVGTISQLISAASSAVSGDVITINSGTYTLTATVNINPGVTVQGAGTGSARPILRAASTFGATVQETFGIMNYGSGGISVYSQPIGTYDPFFHVGSANGNTFRNLILDGVRWEGTTTTERATTPAAGIYMRNNAGGSPSRVHDCDFIMIRGAGIYVGGGRNYEFYNNSFDKTGYNEGFYQARGDAGAEGSVGGLGALSVSDTYEVLIRDNDFTHDAETYFTSGAFTGGQMGGYGVFSYRSASEIHDNYFAMSAFQAYLGQTPNFDIEWSGFIRARRNSFGATISSIYGRGGRGEVYENVFRDRSAWVYGIEINADYLVVDRNIYAGDAAFTKTYAAHDPRNVAITRNTLNTAGSLLWTSGVVSTVLSSPRIFHNTTYLRASHRIGGQPASNSAFVGVTTATDVQIKNNLVVRQPTTGTSDLFLVKDGGSTPAVLTIAKNLAWRVNLNGFANNFTGDPLLNASLVPGTGSPAINAGDDIRSALHLPPYPSTDYYTRQFPFTYVGAADIGRYEVGSGPSSSTQPNPNEAAARAFDGDPATKWLADFNTTSTVFLGYKSGVGQRVVTYRLTSANDLPARTPKSWVLEGQNAGGAWSQVDARSNESFSGPFVTKAYTAATPGTYDAYRLRVTATAGTSTLTQLAELELIQSRPAYYRIRNRSGTAGQPYIYDAGTLAGYTTTTRTDNLDQWRVVQTSEYIRFYNRATGHALNIETNSGNDPSVRCDVAGADSWASSQWLQDGVNTDNSGYFRLVSKRSSSKAMHLENLNGTIQNGAVQQTWHRAQWQLIPVSY